MTGSVDHEMPVEVKLGNMLRELYSFKGLKYTTPTGAIYHILSHSVSDCTFDISYHPVSPDTTIQVRICIELERMANFMAYLNPDPNSWIVS